MSDRVSDTDVDAFLKQSMTMGINYQFWKNMVDDFAFQGFNPRTFIRDVLLPLVKGDKDQLLAYLQAVAVWVETRGTKVQRNKVISKTNDKGKDIIRRIETLFGITDRIPTDNVTVTLGRMEACVPHLAAHVRAQFPRDVRNLGELNGLELYLAFPGGAALIPSTDKAHFDRWFAWNKKFDALIKPNGVAATPDDRLMTYAQAVWKSPILNDAQRTALLGDLKAAYEEATSGGEYARDEEDSDYTALKASLATTKASDKTYEGSHGSQSASTSGSTSKGKTTAGKSALAQLEAEKARRELEKKKEKEIG